MIKSVKLKRAAILLGIFLISVLIRIPNLDRPLSKHHEFCTALVLQIHSVWDNEGISSFNYNPATNFHRDADKGINNWSSSTHEMKDDKGNYYYVSHPPLAYYLPYFTFKLLHVKSSPLALQIFNMVIHFICALLIYVLVSSLLLGSYDKNRYVTAFMAYSIYVFSPSTMWFQSNVYMSDMLVILFFIAAITSLLAWNKCRKGWMAIGFLACIFLAVYTSWLGVFFLVGLSIYWIWKQRKNMKLLALIMGGWSVAMLALLLMFWQYSLIAGHEVYLEQMFHRYQARGSVKGGSISDFIGTKTIEVLNIFKNYLTGFLPALLILIIWPLSKIRNRQFSITLSENSKMFTWIAILPLIILHLLLLNYSGHDFVQLYGAPAISVLTAILLGELYYMKKLSKGLRNTLFALVVIISVSMYYAINRPGDASWKGDRYAIHKEMGEKIRETAKDSEVVFISGLIPEPQLIYYAKRNIVSVDSLEEARAMLKRRNSSQGIIYYIVDDEIIDMESFSTEAE